MSRTKRTADDWRKAVFKHPAKPSVRLGLIYLADFMDSDRKVSRPRKLMAADLGVSERTVTDMIVGAHDAGLLSTVRPGHKHLGPAVYQALFPDVTANHVVRAKKSTEFSAWLEGYAKPDASQGEETQRAETDEFLHPENDDLSVEIDVTANHVVPTFSNGSQPPACPYHGVDGLPCPTDCRHYSATSSNEEAAS